MRRVGPHLEVKNQLHGHVSSHYDSPFTVKVGLESFPEWQFVDLIATHPPLYLAVSFLL